MLGRDFLLILLVMLIWGLNFVIAKLGIQEIPPIFLIALRFSLVAALLVGFTPLPATQRLPVLWLSFTLGGLHFSLMFSGLRQLDASTAAVAIQLQVPFAVLLSSVLFGDPLGWRRFAGIVLAFVGIVWLIGEPRVGDNLPGLALALAAALVWAVANIQIKALGGIDGRVLNAWVSLFAAPQLLLASWWLEDGQWQALQQAGWRGWSALLYMAFMVTLVGYGQWYRLLGRYSVNQLIPFTLLVPVIGVMSGILLLDEPFSIPIAVGSILTLLGVAVVVMPSRRRAHLCDSS